MVWNPAVIIGWLLWGWLLWGPSAATAAPKAYVGLFKDDAVAVIDMAQNKVVGTIPVPKGPHGLVITPNGRKVYVSSDGASTVSVIDTGSDRVIATIEVGANPHGLAVSGDGRRVLAMGWGTNRVLVIDTATDRVTGEVAVAQPHNGALSRDGSVAWVGSQQQGATALVRLDLTAGKETARVALDKTPRGVEVTPDGTRVLFTLAGSDSIHVLDTPSNQVVAQVPVGASPHHAPVTADGRWALAVVQGPGELAILDTAAGTVAAAVPVGKAPHWSTSSADGRTAYVTNEATNDVSVVDLAGRRVLATIPVGNAPRKIAVQAGATAAAANPATATAAAGKKSKLVTMSGATYADHGTKDVRKLSKLELEADDYYFGPTFLRGNPGQKLTLMIENEVGTLHNITIPALGVDKDIPPRGKVQLDVTFPASGVLTFSCKFHGPLGMAGMLRVGE
jgi:YVTN family beta-propeller protein